VPVEAQDTLQVREQHFDLLPFTARLGKIESSDFHLQRYRGNYSGYRRRAISRCFRMHLLAHVSATSSRLRSRVETIATVCEGARSGDSPYSVFTEDFSRKTCFSTSNDEAIGNSRIRCDQRLQLVGIVFRAVKEDCR
jgi:hypothetical protein